MLLPFTAINPCSSMQYVRASPAPKSIGLLYWAPKTAACPRGRKACSKLALNSGIFVTSGAELGDWSWYVMFSTLGLHLDANAVAAM